MKKSVASKVIALALVIMGVCNIVAPIISYAALSNQLGTQAALGSPLLNQNFSTDDFQKYEPLAFGVFLSNFCVPLVDDYKSAFATGQGGSEGRGREALQFAGGNDSEANKALQSLLDYSINAQKPMKEISVQYEIYEREGTSSLGIGTTTKAPASPRRANAADLLIEYSETTSSASGAKAGDDTNPVTPWFSADNTDNVTDTMGTSGNTKLALVHKYRMPIFTVKGNDGTSDIVVFDMTDSWDLQVYAMWMGNVAYGTESYKEEANNNMDKMVPGGEPAQATPLYLDTFGNIVTMVDGRCVVMIPAAANQHLTKSRKINLINSVILNGRYTNQSLTSLMENATSAGHSTWDQMDESKSVSGDGISIHGASKGDVYLCFDTDSTLYRHYDESKAGGVAGQDFNAGHGEALVELAEAKMGFSGNKIGLKVCISGLASNSTQNWWLVGFHSQDGYDTLVKNAATAAQQIGSMAKVYPAEIIDYIHTNVAEKDPIFGNHGYIVVSEAGSRKNILGDLVVNGALKYLDGSDVQMAAGVHGMPSQTRMKSTLLSGDINDGTTSAFKTAMYFLGGTDTQTGVTNVGDEKFGPIAQNSLLRQSVLKFDSGMNTASALAGTRIVDVADDVFSTKGNKVEALGGNWWNGLNLSTLTDIPGAVDGLMNGATRIENMTQRVQKVYIPNQNMKSAENIMAIREGTQFAAWTPWIYITYLEAYNVKKDTSDFDTRIFAPGMDILNVDATELLSDVYMSDEEKQKSVNEYTFLMLHPTAGRDYRKGLLIDWINDLIYNSYISMVYGRNVYNYSGGIGSTSSAGFLHFNSYEDNLLTGWFIQRYIENTVMILGIGAIAVVVVGIIMRKRFSWMILSLVLLVNIVLLVPSIGDLTPTIASDCVQKIFSSKANFWALEESIANQALEERYIAETGGSSKDAGEVHTYMKMMSTVNLDRTLMLKQDISKKVVENATGIMNVVQENASTRWLLPRLMSQFNASDGSKDFVHVTLGDTFDNWANLYWLYEPNDRVNAGTINASSVGSTSATKLDYMARKGLWDKFEETSGGSLYDSNPDLFSVYQSSYTPDGGKETWKSNSRAFNETDVATIPAHTVSYIIPDLHVPSKMKEQSWDELAQAYDLNGGGSRVTSEVYEEWMNALVRIEGNASAYNPREIGALPDFGYLWATENPGTYFYQVVKETYARDNTSFAELAGNIQGNYINSSYTGDEARVSSMHFSNTGKVKDILDLEEMFTNMIPYIQSVQTVACGTDGTNGIFGDMKLEDYHIYEDNNASWLFRSNWVTKIAENKYYTKPVKVNVPGFEAYEVLNPTDPRCYPVGQGRPMIFSEAQQDAYGIPDSDLTLVELKCIAVNKSVERRWSLLLNYVNTSGMTLEVMCRQMALEALLEFNKEFSDVGVSNSSLMMYPTSIDLRYLSFDSIMKMLVLNSSGNASYIYGDTMKAVIENSDFVSVIMLLLGAFLCQAVVPLVRDIIMGLVLYLGIWSVLCNIFAGGRAKLKVCAGYAISNGVYLVLTIAYYAAFGILIKMNTADEVLSINNITVDNGPPIFSFLIIIVVSILYFYGTIKMIKFVLKNFKDLGFEVYAAWGSMVAGKIGDGLSGIKSSIEGMRGDNASASAASSSGTGGAAVAGAAAGAVAGAAGAAVLIQQAEDAKTGDDEDTSDSGYTVTESGYTMTEEVKAGEGRDVDFDIDRAIERGHAAESKPSSQSSSTPEPATVMDETAKPEDSDAE